MPTVGAAGDTRIGGGAKTTGCRGDHDALTVYGGKTNKHQKIAKPRVSASVCFRLRPYIF
jgi:hypothetical protein